MPPPGPRSRELCATLGRVEAPLVNTLFRGQPSVVWRAARGANVLDVDGNRYLDGTSGFGAAAIGHAHPAVVDAVQRQAGILLHGLADVAAHPARIALASRLSELAPLPDAQVYFAVSGSDAVEVALKTAHLATGRSGLLVFDTAYHGVSIGTLAATSRDAFRSPFRDVLRRAVHRLPWGCSRSELEHTLAVHGEEIGCVLFEPVEGREGIHVPAPGWLGQITDRCRERGLVIVADEIFTGFGRLGSMFAVQQEGVEPDLLCCGKALGGGMPIGAVLGRRGLLASWDAPGEALHTGTFLAQPLSCAAALAVLDVLESEALIARVAAVGPRLDSRLEELERYSIVVERRGRGLLWGIELTTPDAASATIALALADGLLLLASGPDRRVLELVPPFIITDEQLERALDILEAAIAATDRNSCR